MPFTCDLLSAPPQCVQYLHPPNGFKSMCSICLVRSLCVFSCSYGFLLFSSFLFLFSFLALNLAAFALLVYSGLHLFSPLDCFAGFNLFSTHVMTFCPLFNELNCNISCPPSVGPNPALMFKEHCYFKESQQLKYLFIFFVNR